jgi:hypothetical protein
MNSTGWPERMTGPGAAKSMGSEWIDFSVFHFFPACPLLPVAAFGFGCNAAACHFFNLLFKPVMAQHPRLKSIYSDPIDLRKRKTA